MKKSLFMTGLIALILMMVSCNNIASPGGKIKGGDDDGIAPGMRTLTGTITSENGSIARSAARDIKADAYGLGDLDYYLEGTTAKAAVKQELTKLEGTNAVNTTSGAFSITLAATVWNLTLYAVPGGTALTDSNKLTTAVLMANAVVDLTNSEGAANFVLSAGKLTKEAKVTLTLTTEGNWLAKVQDQFTVTAGIYKLASGEAVGTPSTMAFSGTPLSATYTNTSVSPGIYAFSVIFKEKTTNPKEFYYTDKIFVEPGHDITKPVEIKNIVGTPATAPTDFKAFWADPDGIGTYSLIFQWTRGTPEAERAFEIELIDFSNVTTDFPTALPTDATEWNTAAGNAQLTEKDKVTLTNKVYANQTYYAGGLSRGNTNLVIRRDLGTAYIARIRALSDGGNSDWTYVTRFTGTLPTLTGLVKVTSTAKTFDTDSKLLNVFRVSYNLNGGSYIPGGATDPVKTNIIEYETKEIDLIKVTPDASDPKQNVMKKGTTDFGTNLKNGTAMFIQWVTENASTGVPDTPYTGATAGSYKYAGPKNLDLYADFTPKVSGSVDVFDRGKYSIQPEWITVTNMLPKDATHVNPYTSNAQLTWNFKIAADTQHIGDKLLADDNFTGFDKIELTITQHNQTKQHQALENVAKGTAASFISDTTSWSGTLIATFDAWYQGTIVSTYVYPFDVN